MRVLDRHVVLGYLATTLVILVALVVVIATSFLVEDVRLFAKSAQADGSTMVVILLLRSLIYSHQLMPVAGCLGALVWGAMIARRGELTAIFIGGYSPRRVAAPLAVSAALLAGATFALGELVVPPASNALVRVRFSELYGKVPLESALSRRSAWYRDGRYVLNLPEVDIDRAEFHNPQVFDLDERGRVRSWWQAQLLARPVAGWELRAGALFTPTPDGGVRRAPFAVWPLPVTVTVQDLVDISGQPEQLHLGELEETIARQRATGQLARGHELAWHQRFVFPLSVVVLALIAAPLALAPDRRRGLAGAIGNGSAVAGLGYFVTYLFRSLVSAGDIGPALGAWLPLAVTAGAAALIYRLARRTLGLHL